MVDVFDPAATYTPPAVTWNTATDGTRWCWKSGRCIGRVWPVGNGWKGRRHGQPSRFGVYQAWSFKTEDAARAYVEGR